MYPEGACHGGSETIEQVLRLVAVLISKDSIGKRLAVAGRASIVHQQGRPPARGIDLMLEVEGWPLLAVRTAVNVDDQRVLRRRSHPERLGEESFDRILVIVADEGE